MTDLADIATLAARVTHEAVKWLEGWKAQFPDDPGRKITPDSPLRPLQDAVEAFQAACGPVPLTWGQVPTGWEVQAPDGKWYRVEATGRVGAGQLVHFSFGAWKRDPAGPVTARPGIPDYTDVAIAVLGYPQVLEDGR